MKSFKQVNLSEEDKVLFKKLALEASGICVQLYEDSGEVRIVISDSEDTTNPEKRLYLLLSAE